MRLTMRPAEHTYRSLDMTEGRSAITYRVDGLPLGQEARIRGDAKTGWRIYREIGGVSADPVGIYQTPDEAMAALELEVWPGGTGR